MFWSAIPALGEKIKKATKNTLAIEIRFTIIVPLYMENNQTLQRRQLFRCVEAGISPLTTLVLASYWTKCSSKPTYCQLV